MSPRPRLFTVEAEFTPRQVAKYYVFAISDDAAQEELRSIFKGRIAIKDPTGPVIRGDDINIEVNQGMPKIQDVSLVDLLEVRLIEVTPEKE
jgi:hypothetical protein